MKTLSTIMKTLNHNYANLLKIDTSGEMEVVYNLNKSGFSFRVFDQILMEIHLYHPTSSGEKQRCCYGRNDAEKTFQIFNSHGFRIISLQPADGHIFKKETCCAEVAWARF